MRIRFICSIMALVGIFMGLSFSVPALTDYYYGTRDSMRIITYLGLCIFSSCLFAYLSFKFIENPTSKLLNTREKFLTRTLVWFFCSFLGALPFYFDIPGISFIDAWFESVSGLTTTGSTILSGLDTLPKGLLMWRSMLQWIGGIGIIIIVLTFLPILKIGGTQFFLSEFSGDNLNQPPTFKQTVRWIIPSFIIMTLLCMVALNWAGMNLFDSLTHAMTTIATGGFSTHDASIGFYNNPKIEWVLIIFMFIAGLPLMLWGQIIRNKWSTLKSQVQIKSYINFLIIATFILILARWINGTSINQENLRSSLFSIVSIVTTTGFVSSNYALWGSFSVMFFLLLLNVGACNGSSSGGIKMFRFEIANREMLARLKSAIYPHKEIQAKYGNKTISEDIASSVVFFLDLYIIIGVICALCLSLTGLDILTSLSATLTSLANVGPGLGLTIGPESTFASLSNTAKLICSFAMLLGRLEFTSIVILFLPFFWKKQEVPTTPQQEHK